MRRSPRGSKSETLNLVSIVCFVLGIYIVYVWISSGLEVASANNTTSKLLKEIKGKDREMWDQDSSHHFLATNKNSISGTLCNSRDYEVAGVEGILLHENYKHEVTSLFTEEDRNAKKLVHYQLCYSTHSHQHQFRLSLSSSSSKEGDGTKGSAHGDCDMFMSSAHPFPREPDQWQWKSTEEGSDSITLNSYLQEFQSSNTHSLFITIAVKPADAIHAQHDRASAMTVCTFSIEVATLENDALLKKIGLRGGQRLLPRDIRKIIHE